MYGDDAAAQAVKGEAAKAFASGDSVKHLLQFVNQNVGGWEAKWARGRASKMILEPTYQLPEAPMLLQLGPKHSVSIVGKYVFDSNFEHALVLSHGFGRCNGASAIGILYTRRSCSDPYPGGECEDSHPQEEEAGGGRRF